MMMSDMLTAEKAGWVQCGKYAVEPVSGMAVMIRAEDGPGYPGVWRATGEEAAVILGCLDDGNPGMAEGYIDSILGKTPERFRVERMERGMA